MLVSSLLFGVFGGVIVEPCCCFASASSTLLEERAEQCSVKQVGSNMRDLV